MKTIKIPRWPWKRQRFQKLALLAGQTGDNIGHDRCAKKKKKKSRNCTINFTLCQHQTPFLCPTRCIQQHVKSHLGAVSRPPSQPSSLPSHSWFSSWWPPTRVCRHFLLFLVTLTLPAPFGQCLFSGPCNFLFQSLTGAPVKSAVRGVFKVVFSGPRSLLKH